MGVEACASCQVANAAVNPGWIVEEMRKRAQGRGGGVIHLRRQHKATNMASFPVVSCASSQASFHYSSGRRLVEDELPAGANSSESRDFCSHLLLFTTWEIFEEAQNRLSAIAWRVSHELFNCTANQRSKSALHEHGSHSGFKDLCCYQVGLLLVARCHFKWDPSSPAVVDQAV